MSLRDKVTAEIGDMFATQADGSWWDVENAKLTESPIETAFLVTLEYFARLYCEDVAISKDEPKDLHPNFFSLLSENIGPNLCWTYIQPQAQIGDYRVDFLITFRCGDSHEALVVECDGHDFHDRTPFQASRDRERDRALVSNGHRVFRFTGTDINRRPVECAYDIMMFILSRRAEAGKRREEQGK